MRGKGEKDFELSVTLHVTVHYHMLITCYDHLEGWVGVEHPTT